jgi:hypothetical protein
MVPHAPTSTTTTAVAGSWLSLVLLIHPLPHGHSCSVSQLARQQNDHHVRPAPKHCHTTWASCPLGNFHGGWVTSLLLPPCSLSRTLEPLGNLNLRAKPSASAELQCAAQFGRPRPHNDRYSFFNHAPCTHSPRGKAKHGSCYRSTDCHACRVCLYAGVTKIRGCSMPLWHVGATPTSADYLMAP